MDRIEDYNQTSILYEIKCRCWWWRWKNEAKNERKKKIFGRERQSMYCFRSALVDINFIFSLSFGIRYKKNHLIVHETLFSIILIFNFWYSFLLLSYFCCLRFVNLKKKCSIGNLLHFFSYSIGFSSLCLWISLSSTHLVHGSLMWTFFPFA